MTLNSSAADYALRFDKAVTGYLDLQTILNKDQLAVFQPIIAPAGEKAQLLFASILELGKLATATEIRVRENERRIKFKQVKLGSAFDASAAVFNQQAIRYAGRALNLVKDLEEDLRQTQEGVRGVGELRDVHKDREFSKALDDARDAFLTNALELNFTDNREFGEVVEIWDKTIALARQKGIAGVLGAMSQSLQEFTERRNSKERGTSPASPLPWWKYVVIGLYIGAAAFAVFACFFWSACVWVWPAISATAPWIFKIIEMGC